MSEAGYPVPVGEVVRTLSEIFRHLNRMETVELLDSAQARFEEMYYDNLNGGTYTWALCLDVPVPHFVRIGSRIGEIEKEIAEKLSPIERNYPNNPIGEVRVTPVSSDSVSLSTSMSPPDVEVRRLWPDGRFRLFLSHLSSEKIAVSKLKSELEVYGISAFVAHEDIEPSLEWRNEIELGLKSMHALVALISPEFHLSNWTDQEIGWALGRGLPVIPVRLGKDPYGFVGKYQAITGDLGRPVELASKIVNILILKLQTHSEMRRSLVDGLAEASSFAKATRIKEVIVKAIDFSEDEKVLLRSACVKNSQVSGAFGVTAAIYGLVGKAPEAVALTSDDIPF